MDFDRGFTNEDCQMCYFSKHVDIGCEYRDFEWQCAKGHRIEGVMANDKKPCGLIADEYYAARVDVFVERNPQIIDHDHEQPEKGGEGEG